MTDKPRLIEFAFPLKQASLDSVHEKNVRHGHISTLHIWPARRPLAACRAALLATLLPDPGTPEKRQELCEKIAGKVVKRIEKKKMPGGQVVEREKEETEGGILHWGRETENAETLEWFRQEIRNAYGGRAPKVLDPFAGGGAIPLEAMRLGCEATAIDINPVAWFILKCTLEYPQKLAGKKLPLPAFILRNREFMEAYLKAQGLTKAAMRAWLEKLTKRSSDAQKSLSEDADVQFDLGEEDKEILEADLAWQVRTWGQWVLDQARSQLAKFYPVYADFEPLEKDKKSYEHQPMRLVPQKNDGAASLHALNAEFGADYLEVKSNPRWVAKPAVAYLWAHTVECKNCRATIPLLKTRWLCKKDRKRVLLTMEPKSDMTGVQFDVVNNVPVKGGNTAQRREHDKILGEGTVTKAGARCPCCRQLTMTKEDIQVEGRVGKLGVVMTAVIVDGPTTKEYRLPTELELATAADSVNALDELFSSIPGGKPSEKLEVNAKGDTWCVLYGRDRFEKLFTPRQLLSLGSFCKATHDACERMHEANYPSEWIEAIVGYTYCSIARLADRNSEICTWQIGADKIGHTFARYVLPFMSDFVEVMPWADSSGGFGQGVEWVGKVASHLSGAEAQAPTPLVERTSAIKQQHRGIDLIVTDPPYYDAIGYAVVMDFFAVWLRRTLKGCSGSVSAVLAAAEGPKWDPTDQDGELVDDASRFEGDKVKSKASYEGGMARAFRAGHAALSDAGRMVVVFAHKDPDAWETLVTAMIQAGFVVDGSWPIMTERTSRMRSMGSAALSSSVWLVCKKRPETARAGWDNKVLDDMRANIGQRLREFWDAGIRGPDFVWAATGPALEAYSKHPVVKMADDPGKTLTVTEFLNYARRMVVDFVVGRVLGSDESDDADASFDRLDELTAYYLLHRNDFGLDEAPIGACILYATACGLSDQELIRDWDLLVKTSGDDSAEEDTGDEETEGDQEPSEEPGSGSKVKLKAWNQRRGRSLGIEAPGGRPVPLIDRIHRLMHLWKAGDAHKVDEYIDEHGLRRHELFRRVLQSLIELADHGSQERSLLESLSNHIGAKGARKKDPQKALALDNE